MKDSKGLNGFEVLSISAIRGISREDALLIAQQQQRQREAQYAQIHLMNLCGGNVSPADQGNGQQQQRPATLADTLAEIGIGEPSLNEILNSHAQAHRGEQKPVVSEGSGLVFAGPNGKPLRLDSVMALPVENSVAKQDLSMFGYKKDELDIDLDDPNIGHPSP